jgi:hypothetical protein
MYKKARKINIPMHTSKHHLILIFYMIIYSAVQITAALPCTIILSKAHTRDIWIDKLVATVNPSLACNSSPKTDTSGLVFHFYFSSSDECQLSLKLSAKKQTQVNQMVKIK